MVVEVLSRGNRASVTKEKIAQYFENGARLAWIVQPKSRTVQVYTNGKLAEKVLTAEEKLDGEDVVPGFSLPIVSIFSA